MSPKKIIFSFVSYFFRGKQYLLFSVLWTFLLTVTIARIYSTYFSWYLFIRGHHIHHFYTGMVLVSIGAILLLLLEKERAKLWIARIIGVGFGLIIDEVGLLLSCTTHGLECSYTYGDLESSVSIIFWILMALIIVLELPHDILTRIRAYLKKKQEEA